MHRHREGTLWKWTNYWNGWQPRWFVLDRGTLFYYKSQDEIAMGCKGSINVSAAEITAHAHDNYRLDIVVPGEINFYLKAGSPHERQEWLVALGSVKSCINTEKVLLGIEEDDKVKRKQSELRLYCDLLIQQVHSIRTNIVNGPIPDVKELDESTALLSETCETFIHTLEDCMKLTGRNSGRTAGDALTIPHSAHLSGNGSDKNIGTLRHIDCTGSGTDNFHDKETIHVGDGSINNLDSSDRRPTMFSKLRKSSFAELKLDQDGSVPMSTFLDCCNGLTKFFDLLSDSGFAPVRMDFCTHVRRLTQKYESDRDRYWSLQRLLDDEIQQNASGSVASALLWTIRNIEFVREILQSYLDDKNDLTTICLDAYTKTLRPHHDWVTRSVFMIASKSAVAKEEFTSSLVLCEQSAITDSIRHQLKSEIVAYLAGIDRCTKSVKQMLAKYNLDSTSLEK